MKRSLTPLFLVPLMVVSVAAFAKNEAKLVDAKFKEVTAIGPKGGINGHAMTFSIQIDAGKSPAGETYPKDDKVLGAEVKNAVPYSVFGVTMEWWERIETHYDFESTSTDAAELIKLRTAGTGKNLKPWSDLYAFKPDAKTYDNPFGTFTWLQAVKDARDGKLSGAKTIEFTDQPGFGAANKGTYKKRVLRFRAVTRDVYGVQKESYAVQVLLMENGEVVYKSYNDSDGHKLSEGKSTDAGGASLLGAKDEVPVFNLGEDVPLAAMNEVPAFAKQVADKKAADFKNVEYELFQSKKPGNGSDLYNLFKSYIGQDYDAVPLTKAGWSYKAYPIKGGGQLVGLVEGTKIRKLYFTPDQLVKKNKAVGGPPTSVDARTFAEYPVERVGK